MTQELREAVERLTADVEYLETDRDGLTWPAALNKPGHETRRSFARDLRLILSALAGAEASPVEREAVARLIYESDPFYEGGEYVDGFCVSPGGYLSWEEAQARDAEFGDDPVFKSVLASAYTLADAIMALRPVQGVDEEGSSRDLAHAAGGGRPQEAPSTSGDLLKGIDFIYNLDAWDCTYGSDMLAELFDGCDGERIIRLGRLVERPAVYAANVVIDWNYFDDGSPPEPNDWEIKLFASQEEAEAAVNASPPAENGPSGRAPTREDGPLRDEQDIPLARGEGRSQEPGAGEPS